ncbi:MAG: hypothetical protein II368_05735 [Clostridia bacterium]|nr:hypothetical protein [Clostridia bacterium]
MAKVCKILEFIDKEHSYIEASINEWLNNGYEVKHIVHVGYEYSGKDRTLPMTSDHSIRTELNSDSLIFYLEKIVPNKPAPVMTAKKPTILPQQEEDLPF